MAKHLFFITSVSEAKQALKILYKLGPEGACLFISNSPHTNLFLEKKKVAYKDAADYFPNKKTVKKMYDKINEIINIWYKKYNLKLNNVRVAQQIGFSLHNYLAEVEHSLETAKRIINLEKPAHLHITNYWTETPYRRYQTENFNLEHLALINLSKINGTKITNFKSNISQSLNANSLLFILTILASTAKVTLKQILASSNIPRLENLIVMANYYQLENLIPLLEKLREESINFSLIGNANLKELKRLVTKNLVLYPISNLEIITPKVFNIRLINLIKFFFLWLGYRKKLRNFFNQYDRNYWRLTSPKFLYYFLYDLPLISNLITNSQKAFKKKKMFLTMATTDTISHSISYSAKLSGLKVLELQHGMLFTDVDRMHRLNDYYLLWGPRAREVVVKSKPYFNKYPMGGYPLFDKYKKHNYLKLKPKLKKKLGISSKTKTILILAVFPTGLARINQKISPFQFIDMIFQTINHLNGSWKVIFRPHPSFRGKWVVDKARQHKIDFYYDSRKLPIEEAIIISDIVIANPTTPILDAMFLKKPVLTFLFHYDLGSEISKSFLIRSGAAVQFGDVNQLKIRINRSIEDVEFKRKMGKAQKKFLEEYCMAFSDSSTDRTVRTILNLMESIR